MTGQQAAMEQAHRAVEQGEWPRDEINVLVIRIMGVRLIQAPIPRMVRSELSQAVKTGKLGRLPRKGLLPEAYFHPNSRGRAIEKRRQVAFDAAQAIAKIAGRDPAELKA